MSDLPPCSVYGCSCEHFQAHKWIPERCLCFHQLAQHKPPAHKIVRSNSLSDEFKETLGQIEDTSKQSELDKFTSAIEEEHDSSHIESSTPLVLEPDPAFMPQETTIEQHVVIVDNKEPEVQAQQQVKEPEAEPEDKVELVEEKVVVVEEQRVQDRSNSEEFHRVIYESVHVAASLINPTKSVSESVDSIRVSESIANLDENVSLEEPVLKDGNSERRLAKVSKDEIAESVSDRSKYFSDSLKGKGLDKFAIAQAKQRVGVLEHTRRLFLKIAVAEKEYSKVIDRIIAEEHESSKASQIDRITYGTSADLYGSLIDTISNQSYSRREFSDYLSNVLCSKLEDDFQNLHVDIKEIEKRESVLQDRVSICKDKVSQTKAKTLKYLEQASTFTSRKKSIISVTKRLDPLEISNSLSQYSLAYEKSLETMNDLIDRANKSYSPLFLNEIQKFEEKRISSFNESIESYLKSRKELSEKEVKNSQALIDSNLINPRADINSFVSKLTSIPLHQRADLKRMNYELPETMEQILNKVEVLKVQGNMSKKNVSDKNKKDSIKKQTAIPGNNNSVNPNLQIGSVSQRIPPSFDLDPAFKCPRIFSYFRRLLLDMNGVKTEGIFRINGDFAEVQRLMNSVIKEKTQIKPSNVHCVSSLLRRYLRDHYEPLLVESKAALVESLGQSLQSPDEKHSEDVSHKFIAEIIETLPAANRLMIKGLVALFREILRPENVATNKMSAPGLSIVFGPIFVSIANEVDQQKILSLSRLGSIVVEMLIEKLDTSEYPEAEEQINKSSLLG